MTQSERDIQYLERHILVLDHEQPQVIILENSVYRIGRTSSNEIALNCDTISRQHATLLRQPKSTTKINYQYQLVDGDSEGKPSKNGIFVNGERCHSHELRNGDRISFGGMIEASYLTVSMEDETLADFQVSIASGELDSQPLTIREILENLEFKPLGQSYLAMSDPTSIMLGGPLGQRQAQKQESQLNHHRSIDSVTRSEPVLQL